MMKVAVWIDKEHFRTLRIPEGREDEWRWPMLLGIHRLRRRQSGTAYVIVSGKRFTVVPGGVDGITVGIGGELYYKVVSQP